MIICPDNNFIINAITMSKQVNGVNTDILPLYTPGGSHPDNIKGNTCLQASNQPSLYRCPLPLGAGSSQGVTRDDCVWSRLNHTRDQPAWTPRHSIRERKQARQAIAFTFKYAILIQHTYTILTGRHIIHVRTLGDFIHNI